MGDHAMSIELDIKITSPLTADDKDLLSGVAVMVLAVADRELARQRFPETFLPDEGTTQQAPPCGAGNPESASEVCVDVVGHCGRHRFRARGLPN
jgi:hypothetical protein